MQAAQDMTQSAEPCVMAAAAPDGESTERMEMIAPYIAPFLFILLRAGTVMLFLPVLGSRSVPAPFKIGLAVAVALLLTPLVRVTTPFERETLPAIVLAEAAFGMALGFVARSVFYAVDMAGQLVSSSMGITMATMINPDFGESSEVSRLFGFIALLLFLATDGHHDVITLFVLSFDALPPGQMNVAALLPFTLAAFSGMLAVAIKLSAPVVVIMLVMNVVLGFMSKAAPSMNVFFVAYPLYLFVGFLVMAASAPAFAYAVNVSFGAMRDELGRMAAAARL